MPDALQEFSDQTSNYNAEYGQNAGGVVNIITKSGGNQWVVVEAGILYPTRPQRARTDGAPGVRWG
jgi:outer membrane cobalamin receptor